MQNERKSRNNRDQQPRDPQNGDEESRQPRNRNQRNERDNNRKQATKESVIEDTPITLNDAEIAEEGDDQRPSKRPAGRRTRSQQRRRNRREEGENSGAEIQEGASSNQEPITLSESAQLAQQISAAIAEHAQQAQANKAQASPENSTPDEAVTEPNPEQKTIVDVATTETVSIAAEEPEKTNKPISVHPVKHLEEATEVEALQSVVTEPVEAQASVWSEPEAITVGAIETTKTEAAEVTIETTERQTVTEVNITPTRAGNDPRNSPKPIGKISIITETIESQSSRALDTSLPPNVDHNPRQISRPLNDPRLSKHNSEQ